MFLFGHTGVGFKVFHSMKPKRAEAASLLVFGAGALFPDICDKVLYYSIGDKTGLISGTRTFGHSLLLLVCLLIVAKITSRRVLFDFCIGIATHLSLDHGPEVLGEFFSGMRGDPYRWQGFLWPLLGLQFPVQPFANLEAHAMDLLTRPAIIIGEPLGIYFVFFRYRTRWLKELRQYVEAVRTRRSSS